MLQTSKPVILIYEDQTVFPFFEAVPRGCQVLMKLFLTGIAKVMLEVMFSGHSYSIDLYLFFIQVNAIGW